MAKKKRKIRKKTNRSKNYYTSQKYHQLVDARAERIKSVLETGGNEMTKGDLYKSIGGAFTLFDAALKSLIRKKVISEEKKGRSKVVSFISNPTSTNDVPQVVNQEAVDFMTPRTVRASTQVLHSIVSDYSLNDKQKTDMLSHYNQIILDNGINETKATGR